MIKNPERWAEFERADARRPGRALTYEQALRLVEALWQEARALGTVPPADPWRGLEADLEIARTLNAVRPPAHV